MAIQLRKSRVLAAVALSLSAGSTAFAAEAPTVSAALQFQPLQKDVQIDRPEGEAIKKCTIKAEKVAGKTGWVVRDGSGQILRNFMDTNADNIVDQWSYYHDGIEVYRDIDSNFNRKVDQFRWFNTAGTRWGLDTDENGKVDAWKNISAEEATAELVAALRDKDRGRFERVLLNEKELKALGLGAAKTEALKKKVDMALGNFTKLAGSQKLILPESKWVSFGGSQPGLVPAGTDEATADVVVYENVMAMIETEGKAMPIAVGAMVKVKDNWRVIDLPTLTDNATAENEQRPFFFPMPRNDQPETPIAKANERVQELMKKLQALPEISQQSTEEEHNKRYEYIEALAKEAETPEARDTWYKQLADTLNTAVQAGNYPAGIGKLKELAEKLKAEKLDELAFYAQFRYLTADHTQKLAAPNPDFAKIQTEWVRDLEGFLTESKNSPEGADAMLELAIAQEFNQNEEEALKWYESIVKGYPDPKSTIYRKAAGAAMRLTSVGKQIPLKGKTATGQAFDLKSSLKDKVVVIQYWATWAEPAKSDMPLLKDLRNRFKGFEVVGVCLDQDKKEMLAFLEGNPLPWPQLYEEGGLENRFATEMGIQIVPTMILVDKTGKVVSRNISNQDLEAEVKKLLK